MDGDCHSIDAVREAIQCLQKQCGPGVATTVFAPPQRCQNKKWMEFLKEDGIDFRPIHRSTKRLAEPNDKAIIREMRRMSRSPSICIALLIQDGDFVEPVLDIINERGSDNILVLIPKTMRSVIQTYETQGVTVLKMSPNNAEPTRVRAILHQDGSGSVKLAEPYEPLPQDMFAPVQDEVAMFLQNVGYGEARDGYMVQKCAKFWFANKLGSLTVSPTQPAVLAVHRFLAESDATGQLDLKEYAKKLAYFLPVTTRRGKLKKGEDKTFGCVKMRCVFDGGGPFILEDSSDLVLGALRRLGYMDDGFNTDVPEAMFLFMNSAENKGPLRKFGWLPRPSDNRLDVDGNLRKAFISDATAGMWQVKHNSQNAMESVLKILKRAKVISSHSRYSKEETFEAMKSFVRQQQLPSMRTFNGLRWSILRYHANATDPSKRSVVDFDR